MYLNKKIKVDNAIILAAGYGSRLAPITYEQPKGLISIDGQPIIERQIEQLHEVGIKDITIVTGYLKEKFDYLKEKYDLNLVYCDEYKTKNNLSSLYKVRNFLKNTYILSSDNYIIDNIFCEHENRSWYCALWSEGKTSEWCMNLDEENRICNVEIGGKRKWYMYGPVFFPENLSKNIIPFLSNEYSKSGTEHYYWENVLIEHLDELEIFANCQKRDNIFEFETLEELRTFDAAYNYNANNKIMEVIAQSFSIKQKSITKIEPVKFGMTNDSFTFKVKGVKYICRIPGEGADVLINRKHEFVNINAAKDLNLSDDVIYFDTDSGLKISRFIEDSRHADINNYADVKGCIKLLKHLHNCHIRVSNCFEIGKQILFYEELCIKNNIVFDEDYFDVRDKNMKLLSELDKIIKPLSFTHIDPAYENFLILNNGDIKLIDWEYAGMCDPLIDISMFALYAGYNDNKLKEIIDHYFDDSPSSNELFRINAYMSLGGFLWYLWSLYKESIGKDFKDYRLLMFEYAKKYCVKTLSMMKSNC